MEEREDKRRDSTPSILTDDSRLAACVSPLQPPRSRSGSAAAVKQALKRVFSTGETRVTHTRRLRASRTPRPLYRGRSCRPPNFWSGAPNGASDHSRKPSVVINASGASGSHLVRPPFASGRRRDSQCPRPSLEGMKHQSIKREESPERRPPVSAEDEEELFKDDEDDVTLDGQDGKNGRPAISFGSRLCSSTTIQSPTSSGMF